MARSPAKKPLLKAITAATQKSSTRTTVLFITLTVFAYNLLRAASYSHVLNEHRAQQHSGLAEGGGSHRQRDPTTFKRSSQIEGQQQTTRGEATKPINKTWLFYDKGGQFYHETNLACSVPWNWTTDEFAADAILYNVLESEITKLVPRKVRPEQKNVYISLESGSNYPEIFTTKRRGFDIMMDYRVYDHPKGKADVPVVYYNNALNQKDPVGDLSLPPKLPKRTDAWIAVFISDCDPANNRNEILEDLMAALPEKVHSYGKCFHNIDEPDMKELLEASKEEGGHYMDRKAAKIALSSQYLFAFSAENSNEPGYVTEKVYQALEAGTLPIYIGAPDVDKFLPHPSAVIKAADFSSTAALAAYLKELAADGTKYLKHFEWKKKEYSDDFKRLVKLSSTTAHCRLAKYLAGVPMVDD